MELKSLLFCAVLSTALTASAFADNPPAPKVKNVITEFAESHLVTDAKKLSKIMSEDAQVKFSRGNEVLYHSLASILKLMRQNEGISQNCSTSYDIIASSEALVMAKVEFAYQDFVIENYLTLERDKNDNWKITRINKFFTDNAPANVLSNK